MAMHRMAVIGDASSIAGFAALGLTVMSTAEPAEAASLVRKADDEGHAVIFVTEGLAKDMPETLAQYSGKPLPILLIIPDNEGHVGGAMAKLKNIVERALGADILFGKEGSDQ